MAYRSYTLLRTILHKNNFRFSKRTFHATLKCNDLMEFFEPPENWGAKQIKSGRAWKKEELRIKSNEDLHKLWFVLYKEKNMLLTMEHDANENCELFPSPERIDKVEESMENIEEVVKERNKAYYELEIGKSGLRETDHRMDIFGRVEIYHKDEHFLSSSENPNYKEPDYLARHDPDVESFHKLMHEKIAEKKKEEEKNAKDEILNLFERFPDLDKEALQERYPNMNIEKIYQEYLSDQ